MIEVLRENIRELKNKKIKLKNDFLEGDSKEHLSIYVEIKSIEFAIELLQKIIIQELHEMAEREGW